MMEIARQRILPNMATASAKKTKPRLVKPQPIDLLFPFAPSEPLAFSLSFPCQSAV
jgi:hypothetical protein